MKRPELRLIARLLVALFCLTLVGCEKNDGESENGGADVQQSEVTYFGQWINEDVNTDSITRINITDGSVHMWGRCSPADCDWGEAPYLVSDNSLAVSWDQGFVIRAQVLSFVSEDRLCLVTESRFTDGTDRDYDLVDYFTRL